MKPIRLARTKTLISNGPDRSGAKRASGGITPASVSTQGSEYFNFFADRLPDILYVFNMESKQMEYMSASVERFTGYTAEEIIQLPHEKLFTKESFEQFHLATVKRLEPMKEGKQMSQIYVDELIQYRKDGSFYYAEFSNHFTINADGAPIVIGIVRDITDRKLLQQSMTEKLVKQQRREEIEKNWLVSEKQRCCAKSMKSTSQ